MKILLATDGSQFSEAAVRAVITQARPQRDEVRVLYVVDILTSQLPEMVAYYALSMRGMRNETRRKPS